MHRSMMNERIESMRVVKEIADVTGEGTKTFTTI